MSLVNEIINIMNEVEKLPNQLYTISVYDSDCKNEYITVDIESGMVGVSTLVADSCGCCHHYECIEEPISNIKIQDQFEILNELFEKYCIKE